MSSDRSSTGPCQGIDLIAKLCVNEKKSSSLPQLQHMAIHSFPSRFALFYRAKSALLHLLTSSMRNGRLIAALILSLFILLISLVIGLQRGETARFSQMLDLHLAMDQWRQKPATRAEQLPHLCHLFRLHPNQLKRFGGEFLSSAILLRGKMGKEGSQIAHWFLAQQKRWSAESVPHFAEATLMAAKGDYASVAKFAVPSKGDDRFQNTGARLDGAGSDLLAYHLTRRAACGYLSRNKELFEETKEQLLRAAALLPVGERDVKRGAQVPYDTLFASYRTGRLTLLDWAQQAT